MTDTYTKYQIAEARERVRGIREIAIVGGKPTDDETKLVVLESALSTAEQERDDAQGIADQMCDEFQRIRVRAGSESEIAALCDRAMLKLKQTIPIISYAEKAEQALGATQARCAELEGGLVGAIKSIDEGKVHSVKRIRKMLIDVLDAIVGEKEDENDCC